MQVFEMAQMSYAEDEEHTREFEDLRKIVKNVDEFSDYVNAHSSQIVWPHLDNPLDTEYGCGTFAIVSGVYGIFTAAHVADIFQKKESSHLYIPDKNSKNFGLIGIKFLEIIKLPDIKGISSIDLAFIRLDSPQEIIAQGKKFIDLNISKEGSLDFIKTKISNLQCCGFLGAPSDGKRLVKTAEREFVEYPKGAIFHGDIKKNSYFTYPFFFPASLSLQLSEMEFRYDEFKSTWTDRKGMPAHFTGTSGSGFWAAELSRKDNHFICDVPTLVGVIIIEDRNGKDLICRGPISIYETFLAFCSIYLKTNNFDEALQKASASFIAASKAPN